MDDLKRKTDLARALFGSRGQRADAGVRRTQAVAASASDSGSVAVEIDGQTIEVPTTGQVAEGEAVVLDVEQGGTVVAHGSVGWGDRLVTEIGETYATYSSVEQTASEIRAEVGETYQSKADAAPTGEASGAMPLTVPAGAAALTLQQVDGPAQPVSALGFFEHPEPPDGAISDDVWSRFAANPTGTARNPYATVEVLEDGWLHVEKQAAGSNLIFAPRALAEITEDGTYTALFEFRNVTVGGTDRLQIAASSYGQLYAGGSYFFEAGSGEHRAVFPGTRTAIRTDHSDLMRFNFSSLMSCSLDIRVSLYRGDYTGGWVPEDSIALVTGIEAVHVDMAGTVLAEGDALAVDALGAAEVVRADSSRVPLGTVAVPALTGGAVEWRAVTYPATTGAVGWLTAYGSDLAEVYATNASLSVQADRITAEVEARTGETAALSTRVTQTESDVSTVITDVDGLQTIIRQTSAGVEVGESGSANRSVQASDGFHVYKGGSEVGFLGEQFKVGSDAYAHIEADGQAVRVADSYADLLSMGASAHAPDHVESYIRSAGSLELAGGDERNYEGWERTPRLLIEPNGALTGYGRAYFEIGDDTGSDVELVGVDYDDGTATGADPHGIVRTGEVIASDQLRVQAGGEYATVTPGAIGVGGSLGYALLTGEGIYVDGAMIAPGGGVLDQDQTSITVGEGQLHLVALSSQLGALLYVASYTAADGLCLTGVRSTGAMPQTWAIEAGTGTGEVMVRSLDRSSVWSATRLV